MKAYKIYNRLTPYLFPCLLALLLSTPAWGEPGAKAELSLRKEDPYLYGACGWCTDLFLLKENDDRKNFSQYNLDTQTGSYLIDLTGPVGTTVTLFGSQNFSREHGYLILVKQDDRPIAVGDLGNLVPRQWIDVNQSDTGPGLYRLWYHPSANFKERIASVRWGQWWSQLPPMNEKE
jgi:hypothetical protein